MNALSLTHEIIKDKIQKGAFCIDATAGRGRDTAFLCELVGDSGKVLAFDIQECALKSTAELLKSLGLSAELILASHADMATYAEPETVDCIVFNLGYLPSGNHKIFTHAETSKKAIMSGLELLKHNGLMCVAIYYGGDSGYEERDALIPFFASLDEKKYQVITASFSNWKNDPPIPVFITKL